MKGTARKAPLKPEEYLGLRLAIASCFAGFVVAGVLVLNHFYVADAAFCSVGDWLSCNTVNRSDYSVVLGVPVALLGMLGFLAVAALSTARMASPRHGMGRLAPPLLTAAVVGGLSFGAYLSVVEVFVLHVVCLLCVLSLLAFVAAGLALRRTLVLPGLGKGPRGKRTAPAEGE